MSLDSFNVVRPNKPVGSADTLGLIIEVYTGLVEGTIKRKSILSNWIPMRQLSGTSTAMNYAAAGATLQAIVPGTTPNGDSATFNKASVTVDTHILSRHYLPELDTLQTQFDARAELSREQGEEVAKFLDQAFFIQAAKAASAVTSPYGAVTNFAGGSSETLSGTEDDPAVIEAGLLGLYEKMANKDVDVSAGDFVVALPNKQFFGLLQSERIISTDYVTSNGTKVEGGFMYKAFGVPVVRTNNIPSTNITAHKLSNARNSNAYNGDFTKLRGLILSPRALMAASTIPVRGNIWYDQLSKTWTVDTDLAFGVAPNRCEYAGQLVIA